MHHTYLDRLAYGQSPLHRLDPRVKLVAAVAAVLAIVLCQAPQPLRLGLYAALVGACVAGARLPWWYLFKRSLLVIPFALAVGGLLPFRPGGHPVAQTTVLGVDLVVTDEGLRLLAVVALKSYIAVWTMLLLASTTRFHRLLAAMQYFGMPRVLTMLLGFLYRYLFVIVGEAIRMRRARHARLAGSARGGRGLRVAAAGVGVLFIRSYERSERVHQAMAARGFDGEVRLAEPLHMHTADWVALGVSLVALAVVGLVPLSGGLG